MHMRFGVSSSEPLSSLLVLREPNIFQPTLDDYPGHEEWLRRLPSDFRVMRKMAQVAFDGVSPIGALVYSTELSPDKLSNIRNISVLPHYRELGVATKLLLQFEIEAKERLGAAGATVDTKLDNDSVIHFFIKHGYDMLDERDLYGSGRPDIILGKSFSAN